MWPRRDSRRRPGLVGRDTLLRSSSYAGLLTMRVVTRRPGDKTGRSPHDLITDDRSGRLLFRAGRLSPDVLAPVPMAGVAHGIRHDQRRRDADAEPHAHS